MPIPIGLNSLISFMHGEKIGLNPMRETTAATCGGNLLLPPHLPEDILIKTLVYLPVKSLLRFKSVCKSWYTLIENSFFIDLHTNTTTNTTSNFGTFIFQTTEPSLDDNKLYMLSSGDGHEYEYNYYDEDNDQKKKMVIKFDDLGFLPFYKDFFLPGASLHMVGTCNGIVCLQETRLANFRDVSLCNPATRQFRILPESIPIKEKGIHWADDFIGFGFDVKTKDYKVLRITTWEELKEKGGCMCRVQVYSLSTDSWRLLDGIDYLPFLASRFASENQGIYLNGCYFFMGRNTGSMILSFDFTKEIFTTMQLPDVNSSEVFLSYLGDKMAVFTRPRNYYYDIWVLNGVQQSSSVAAVNYKEESWTKLHSFQKWTRYLYSIPRCISNNGEFAIISTRNVSWNQQLQLINLVTNQQLQLINLVTKEAKKDFSLIGIQDQRVHKADVYKESLVSIMGGGNGNGNVLLKWQHLPTHGTTTYYKLNLDAPFIHHLNNYFGIGLCLTSDKGHCIRVRSLKRVVRHATEGEALAMLEAIKWVKNLELSPIIIESDSKMCVSFFMDDDDDDNSTYWSKSALSLLKEAKLLLLNNSSDEFGISISFQYSCSKRSCSYVTDVAAKLGREAENWSCKDWTASDFPGEIIRSLSKNLGIETKEDKASKRRAKRRAKNRARKRAKEHRKFASQYQDEVIKMFMRAYRSGLPIAFSFLFIFFFFWYLPQVGIFSPLYL